MPGSGVLSADDARELLTHRLGAARMTAEILDGTGHCEAGLLRAKLGQHSHRPAVHYPDASPAVTARS